jgi:dTDP-glucose 4,6-dehydratase
MTILVTGAAGFIGSNFVLDWFDKSEETIVSLDVLTYAGNLENLSSLHKNPHHHFIQGDICDRKLVLQILKKYKIRAVINFAAESNVDRSIHDPDDFIKSNIVGVYNLLEASRAYWQNLDENLKQNFRFLHISTDEVFGSIEKLEPLSQENFFYQPNNPYSASKAAGAHLVRAWFRTYGLPGLITNSSNNYGPYHFPEKLIPLCILNALNNKPLPIYGNGQQVRDWLYVKDNCRGIKLVLEKGQPGEAYNIGCSNEKTNLEIVQMICKILDELKPRAGTKKYAEQIIFVKDRPGHDKRYAIDTSKIRKNLGWQPHETLDSGFRKTVIWFLENPNWVDRVSNKEYEN